MVNYKQGEPPVKGPGNYAIVLLVSLTCIVMVVIAYEAQRIAVQGALPPISGASPKEQYEIAKFAAEIQQIRSDTSGSLFWLKMIAVFVTVGGAVGGYLLGQSRTTRKKLESEEKRNLEQLAFEKRKNVDLAYQTIIQELSNDSPLLRAAAAVKLGAILRSFPSEWTASDARREQFIELTKKVLSASLCIEQNPKVRKTLTIALPQHKPWQEDSDKTKQRLADLRELDFSHANAEDAYWARVDFSFSDFYGADLAQASFRECVLDKVQFREATLHRAVFIKARGNEPSLKLADLRGADFSEAKIQAIEFDRAKVFGCKLNGHEITAKDPEAFVDVSKAGDGSWQKVSHWLEYWQKYMPADESD